MNPAFGANQQPFAGIPTFMRQPASRDLSGVDAVIVGVPFDGGPNRALQEGLIDPGAYAQLGIRGPTSGERDLEEARELGAEVFTIERVLEIGIPAMIAHLQRAFAGRKVYVTLDIDAADPAFAPGTGTPEVGGFTSLQLLQLVRGLRGLQIVGFDLVEVNPAYDHGEITAILAANLAFEFLSLLAVQKSR